MSGTYEPRKGFRMAISVGVRDGKHGSRELAKDEISGGLCLSYIGISKARRAFIGGLRGLIPRFARTVRLPGASSQPV